MKMRNVMAGVLAAGAVGAAGVAMASPAWAAETAPAGGVSAQSCGLAAWGPSVTPDGGIHSRAGRGGCGSDDTVTYLWARVYKYVPYWFDDIYAEAHTTYVSNGWVDAHGHCGPHGTYYAEASDDRGNAVDTNEVDVC
jgi:hypothetical protein